MSNKFNLLLLSKKMDKHPRTWICVKGKNIKKIISRIESEIIKSRKLNREKISECISQRLFCSKNSIKNLLRGDIKFYPIPVILELCKLSDKDNFYQKIINSSIEFLKVNSASSKPIKAIKVLSGNLAKILGAFCADGSLSMQVAIAHKNENELDKIRNLFGEKIIRESKSRNQHYISTIINQENYNKFLSFSRQNKDFLIQTHYNLELTDEYEDNVVAFNRWILGEFVVIPTNFYKRDNAWRTIFSNKIIARYLITFFGMLPGTKTYTVEEPMIIKNSPFLIRREFAKGVLMFDGCVTKKKTICLNVASKRLSNSIKDIFSLDSISFSESFDNRGFSVISTYKNIKKEKLLNYFEPNTQKWKLLNWLFAEEGINKSPPLIKENKDLTSISFINILQILKKIKKCDARYLMNYFKCSHTTVRDYLRILQKQGKIRLSSNSTKIDNVDEKTTVLLNKEFHNLLFKEMEGNFKSYRNFANFLKINYSTLSAWKVRKNRIPLYVLREMCNMLALDFNEFCKNIEKTDRELIEII